ncbi:eukaryotic aspartyl protease domain-containing protein [Ditylenchus destructor]|uniref:Eukaryotic aspartyl protease domain-containing protein n=1 Tax=Ditylenchus destructor TaxID=166010 RepID=A0AAD4N976_9BILA|nr:eukaryotic aspartyl protease domain-containing protein [Ditylenchus destructor]
MYWKSEANISVGTNAQSLQVYIDPWYATHLNVIGSTANLTFKNGYDYATQRFNSSASTTYFDEAASFSDSYGNGHLGNDILSLSSPLGNVTLGVYDVYRYAFNFVSPALSGILGLSVRDSKHNILQQLAPQLDKPIISIYRQLNDSVDGSGEITLGDLDSTNCQSNWIWADQSDTHYNGPVGNQYDVQLNSVSGTVNGTLVTVSLTNITLSVETDDGFWIRVPQAVHDLVINATGAVIKQASKSSSTSFDNEHIQEQYGDYDGGLSSYCTVACDLAAAPNITLNVGNGSAQVVLTGADYIAYNSETQVSQRHNLVRDTSQSETQISQTHKPDRRSGRRPGLSLTMTISCPINIARRRRRRASPVVGRGAPDLLPWNGGNLEHILPNNSCLAFVIRNNSYYRTTQSDR